MTESPVPGEAPVSLNEARGWLRLGATIDDAVVAGLVRAATNICEAFIGQSPEAADAFRSAGARPGHFMADIYHLARQRLRHAGVSSVSGGSLCTVRDQDWFFSYRRDGQTGRMASIIWLG